MASRAIRLYTLDYVVPPEDMGEVYLYPLTPEFARIWEDLARAWDPKQGFKTPHGALRVALSAATGRMIIIVARIPEGGSLDVQRQGLIVSDGPLDPDLTRVCFDQWQQRNFGTPAATNRLSAHIDFHDTPRHALNDLLERDSAGYITGPWWWKKAIGWATARRLQPHTVIDRTRPWKRFKFALSTSGNLVAWTYPWVRTTNKGKSNERTSYAMAYLSINGETRRGSTDAIVRIDCHVTRVASAWNNVKTVYLKHPQFPTLLHLPVRSLPARDGNGRDVVDADGRKTWVTQFRGHTADIVQACDLDPIKLPGEAHGDLDMVRPVFRNKGKHAIGKGTGAYFTLRMATHISRALGTTPIIYDATRYNLPARSITHGPIPAAKLSTALDAAGWTTLRLVVLYADDATAHRVLRTLHTEYGVDISSAQLEPDTDHDGASVSVAPGITVAFTKAPEITMHGIHDRSTVIQQLPSLQAQHADELVAAICETVWSPGAKIANDAKTPVRRNLAAHGIVSQFLAVKQDDADTTDYPTSRGIRDLLKSCGITDDRLGRAVCASPDVALTAPLTEPVTLIGIHFRRHIYKRVRGRAVIPPKLVAVLTAVHLAADPAIAPRVEMYADGRWRRYAEGRAAFHAGEIGNPNWGRTVDGARNVRSHIDAALDALVLPSGYNRVVIIVDKEGAQSIYPGIGDNPTVTGPLPGRRLIDEGIDVAVVRLALGSQAARPATAFRPSSNLDTMKPSYQRRILFVHDHNDEPSWLLTQDSHQHQGAKSPQRLGTSHSREDFGEIAVSHMGKDMHATGRVEITVPCPGSWDRGDLAILIARLCEQTLSWDNRTSRAVPLHLGHTADQDHPDYGSHDAGGEADDDEPED